MKTFGTPLPGVVLIEPAAYGDVRGFFLEAFQDRRYVQAQITDPFVQDSHSRSRRGVLRGMHFQTYRPQGKLVYVVRGEIFDAVVDVRPGSPTFGQWHGVTLSDENHHQIYVPPGFAHGFQVLSDLADVYYKVTDYYDPDGEGGIPWNDPDVAVAWPLDEPCLSGKDLEHPRLRDHTRDMLPRIGE